MDWTAPSHRNGMMEILKLVSPCFIFVKEVQTMHSEDQYSLEFRLERSVTVTECELI